MAGLAISIGVGPSVSGGDSYGDPWVIGTVANGVGGNVIYHLQGSIWEPVPGAAVAIAVSPDTGTPWVVNSKGTIYEWNGTTFQTIAAGGCVNTTFTLNPSGPNLVNPIAVGPNGDVWVVGCEARDNLGNSPIYHLTSSGWVKLPSIAGISVSVSAEGKPWVVDALGHIQE